MYAVNLLMCSESLLFVKTCERKQVMMDVKLSKKFLVSCAYPSWRMLLMSLMVVHTALLSIYRVSVTCLYLGTEGCRTGFNEPDAIDK